MDNEQIARINEHRGKIEQAISMQSKFAEMFELAIETLDNLSPEKLTIQLIEEKEKLILQYHSNYQLAAAEALLEIKNTEGIDDESGRLLFLERTKELIAEYQNERENLNRQAVRLLEDAALIGGFVLETFNEWKKCAVTAKAS